MPEAYRQRFQRYCKNKRLWSLWRKRLCLIAAAPHKSWKARSSCVSWSSRTACLPLWLCTLSKKWAKSSHYLWSCCANKHICIDSQGRLESKQSRGSKGSYTNLSRRLSGGKKKQSPPPVGQFWACLLDEQKSGYDAFISRGCVSIPGQARSPCILRDLAGWNCHDVPPEVNSVPFWWTGWVCTEVSPSVRSGVGDLNTSLQIPGALVSRSLAHYYWAMLQGWIYQCRGSYKKAVSEGFIPQFLNTTKNSSLCWKQKAQVQILHNKK